MRKIVKKDIVRNKTSARRRSSVKLSKIYQKKEKLFLKLKGKTAVYIDWANVHGWEKSLKRSINTKKLYKYLRSYKEIRDINFYFGTDKNKKSKFFLENVRKIGYSVTTKPVKYIVVAKIKGQVIKKRKCDFDMEICIDVHKDLAIEVRSYIFFTGDGDFEPLYKLLIALNKQVIVVYAGGHIGREIWKIRKGIFKIKIQNLGFEKNRPRSYSRSLPGRD